MKQTLLYASLCLLLVACKKDSVTIEKVVSSATKKYAIKFSVQDFTQSTGPIFSTISTDSRQTTATTPSSVYYYNLLHYVVYDSNGNQVSRMEQDRYDPKSIFRITSAGVKSLISSTGTFGSLTDSLQAGTYTLVVTAGSDYSSLNTPKKNVSNKLVDSYIPSTLANAKFYTSYASTNNDAFYYKGSLQVTATNVPQNIALKRIVGQILVDIEDAIPNEVYEMQYEIKGDYSYYSISKNAPEELLTNGAVMIGVNSTDKGKTDYLYRTEVLNTSTPITIVISALDNKYKVLYTKTITNVKVNLNQVTKLTGKLFDAKAPNGLVVAIDTNWGTAGTNVKF